MYRVMQMARDKDLSSTHRKKRRKRGRAEAGQKRGEAAKGLAAPLVLAKIKNLE